MNDNPIDFLSQSEWDKFIYCILKRFLTFSNNDVLISREELEQEGWMGLLVAAQRYDPKKGVKFTSYAYHYINGYISRYVNSKTQNKPHQISDNDVGVDIKFYLDSTVENKDIMTAITNNVINEKHAELLIEHFIRGKSFRAIAKERGVSHEIISVRVKRLLKLLEIRLNHENT